MKKKKKTKNVLQIRIRYVHRILIGYSSIDFLLNFVKY